MIIDCLNCQAQLLLDDEEAARFTGSKAACCRCGFPVRIGAPPFFEPRSTPPIPLDLHTAILDAVGGPLVGEAHGPVSSGGITLDKVARGLQSLIGTPGAAPQKVEVAPKAQVAAPQPAPVSETPEQPVEAPEPRERLVVLHLEDLVDKPVSLAPERPKEPEEAAAEPKEEAAGPEEEAAEPEEEAAEPEEEAAEPEEEAAEPEEEDETPTLPCIEVAAIPRIPSPLPVEMESELQLSSTEIEELLRSEAVLIDKEAEPPAEEQEDLPVPWSALEEGRRRGLQLLLFVLLMSLLSVLFYYLLTRGLLDP